MWKKKRGEEEEEEEPSTTSSPAAWPRTSPTTMRYPSAVIVGKAPPSLEDIITGAATEKPFDLESFTHYAERHYFSETLTFLVEVDKLRAEPNKVTFQAKLRYILAEFVRDNAPSQVNISGDDRQRTEMQAADVLDALTKDPSWEPDRTSLDAAYHSVISLIKVDQYFTYADRIMVQRRVRISRLQALWWKQEGLTFREFFTFPSPVNASESRMHSCLAVPLVISSAALSKMLGFPYLWLWVTYGFGARTLCGPRIDPQAYFVLFFLHPLVVDKLGLLTDEFISGSPKRFTQGVAFALSLVCTVMAFLEMYEQMMITASCLLMACILWGFCNICLACMVFMGFVHANMMPAPVCEECRLRYVKGKGDDARTKGKSAANTRRQRPTKQQRRGHRGRSRCTISSLKARFSSKKRTAAHHSCCDPPPRGWKFARPTSSSVGARNVTAAARARRGAGGGEGLESGQDQEQEQDQDASASSSSTLGCDTVNSAASVSSVEPATHSTAAGEAVLLRRPTEFPSLSATMRRGGGVGFPVPGVEPRRSLGDRLLSKKSGRRLSPGIMPVGRNESRAKGGGGREFGSEEHGINASSSSSGLHEVRLRERQGNNDSSCSAMSEARSREKQGSNESSKRSMLSEARSREDRGNSDSSSSALFQVRSSEKGQGNNDSSSSSCSSSSVLSEQRSIEELGVARVPSLSSSVRPGTSAGTSSRRCSKAFFSPDIEPAPVVDAEVDRPAGGCGAGLEEGWCRLRQRDGRAGSFTK